LNGLADGKTAFANLDVGTAQADRFRRAQAEDNCDRVERQKTVGPQLAKLRITANSYSGNGG
jgi:hypothetical protein